MNILTAGLTAVEDDILMEVVNGIVYRSLYLTRRTSKSLEKCGTGTLTALDYYGRPAHLVQNTFQRSEPRAPQHLSSGITYQVTQEKLHNLQKF